MFIKEYNYHNAKDFLNALMPWGENIFPKGYIFRGHSDSRYELLASSLRKENLNKLYSLSDHKVEFFDRQGSVCHHNFAQAYLEYQIIRNFYRIADSRGLHVPASERIRQGLHRPQDYENMFDWKDGDLWLPDDILDAAGLAQHYGILTRLLDWTYDPLIAAFFSSRPRKFGSTYDGELCIWGLNLAEIDIRSILLSKESPLKIITPPYAGNPNLASQRGLFTHWSIPLSGIGSIIRRTAEEPNEEVDRTPLDLNIQKLVKNIIAKDRTIFIKATLPHSEARNLAKLLRDIDYGPAKIFPGYAGVCLEIEEKPLLRESTISIT